MSELDASIAGAVHEWVSGERLVHSRVVFAEGTDAAAWAIERARRGDAVLAPDGVAAAPGVAVVPYTGTFREPGDEIEIAGHRIELQDYAAAAFVDVLGPTVVRFGDRDGWRAFLDDADLSAETGILPPPLADARVQLADRAVLREPLAVAAPDAVLADAEGSVRIGAQGVGIGRRAHADLTAPVPRISALGGVAQISELVADVVARPWLPRLLALSDLVRSLPPAQAGVRVPGLGDPLVPDGGADALPHVDDPFLLLEGDAVVLTDPLSRRRFRLARATAQVVEVVQSSASAATAVARISDALGVDRGAAESLRRQAVERLGVRHGAGTPAAHRATVSLGAAQDHA